MSYDDFQSVGYLGLYRACEKWQPEKGSLSAYGIRWIRQAIERYIKTQCFLIARVPEYAYFREDLQKSNKKYFSQPLRIDYDFNGKGFDR